MMNILRVNHLRMAITNSSGKNLGDAFSEMASDVSVRWSISTADHSARRAVDNYIYIWKCILYIPLAHAHKDQSTSDNSSSLHRHHSLFHTTSTYPDHLPRSESHLDNVFDCIQERRSVLLVPWCELSIFWRVTCWWQGTTYHVWDYFEAIPRMAGLWEDGQCSET